MYHNIYKKYNQIICNEKTDYAYYNENQEIIYLKNNSSPEALKIDNLYARCKNYYSSNEESLFYNFVFGNEQRIKTDYRFFVVCCKQNIGEVKNIINDLMEESMIFIYKDMIIVLYHQELEFDLVDVINSIKEDLYINLRLFIGCKISNGKDLYYLLCLYRYCLSSKDYSTIKDLITRTFEKDNRSIPVLKQIVLGKLAMDSQLEKLIISLFDNNLNVSKTSNCVFMHRNTINNKLSLIKDQTGLDIQNFYDALAMFILISKK